MPLIGGQVRPLPHRQHRQVDYYYYIELWSFFRAVCEDSAVFYSGVMVMPLLGGIAVRFRLRPHIGYMYDEKSKVEFGVSGL